MRLLSGILALFASSFAFAASYTYSDLKAAFDQGGLPRGLGRQVHVGVCIEPEGLKVRTNLAMGTTRQGDELFLIVATQLDDGSLATGDNIDIEDTSTIDEDGIASALMTYGPQLVATEKDGSKVSGDQAIRNSGNSYAAKVKRPTGDAYCLFGNNSIPL